MVLSFNLRLYCQCEIKQCVSESSSVIKTTYILCKLMAMWISEDLVDFITQ